VADKLIQNIRKQSLQNFHSAGSSGWHVLQPRPHNGLARVTRKISNNSSAANLERLCCETDLQVLARANVQKRLQKKAMQDYIIPRHQNCKHPILRMNQGNPCLNQAVTKILDLELPMDQKIGLDVIKSTFSSLFSNIAEVMVALDANDNGFLTPYNLINDLQQLEVHPLSVAYALKEVKFVMSDGRIEGLRFMQLFSWGNEKTDEDFRDLWNHSKSYAQVIHAQFSCIKRGIKCIQRLSPKIHKVLSNLSSIGCSRLDTTSKNLDSSSDVVRGNIEAARSLKETLMHKNLGLSTEEQENVSAIVSDICLGELTFEQLQSVLIICKIKKESVSPGAPECSSWCQYGSQKESLNRQTLSALKSLTTYGKEKRPQSAPEVPRDR
jgi:hypothetical protein